MNGIATGQCCLALTIQTNAPAPGSHLIGFLPGPDIDSPVDSVAIAPDGKIYIAGAFTNRVAGRSSYLVARLNPNGSLDESFNLVKNETPADWGRVLQALPTPDGGAILKVRLNRYEVCGGPCAYIPVILAKVTYDGKVDATFPTAGAFVHFTTPAQGGGVVVASDGPVLRGSPRQGTVVRLSSNGTIEAAFHAPVFLGAPSPGFQLPALAERQWDDRRFMESEFALNRPH